MTLPEIILTVFLSLLGAVLLLALLWVFLVAPRGTKKKFEKFTKVRFAHRGLHTEGAPENSLTAFERACQAGFGIELDIRLSKDGELVVFHDETLTRVCGIDGKVSDYTAKELSEFSLSGSSDTVPAFREALSLVGGRVPLLIELKQAQGEGSVAEKFLEEIKDYRGEFIVESFNPLALRKVRRARRDIFLGILSTEYMKEEKFRGKPAYRQLERLRLNFLVRPDFIAYNKNGYGVTALKLLKKIFKAPLFAWTVKSEKEEALARERGFDTVIFENYIPKA